MPDIVLNPVVDSLETVPESYRENYEQRDDKFVLSKPIKIEDTGGLKGALEGERKTLKELREQLGKYKDLPPDVQDRLKKLEQVEVQEAERKGEYQKLIQQNEEKFSTQIKSKEDRISQLVTAISDSAVESTATAAINALDGEVEGLLPHVLPHLRAVEDPNKPGKFTVFVIDKKDPTKERLGPKGQPMTPEELVVADFKEHKVLSKLFRASQASGGNAPGNRFVAPGSRIVKISNDDAKNPERYKQLKAQREKGEIDGVVTEDGRRFL